MTATPLPITPLFDLRFEQVEQQLAADGINPVHARPLWRLLHRPHATRPATLPPPLQRWIDSHPEALPPQQTPFPPSALRPGADGLSHKLALRLADRQEIETVVLRYPGRHTACLSTQAGCAMGCVFCATGQMGFARHLRPGEILGQIHVAQALLRAGGHPGLRNLVLMGMGEPLHNYDHVVQALRIATDPRGLNLGPSRIAVSTVGVVPGIVRMADDRLPYRLAVSLHAADDATRTALVPANARWPLAELLDACRYYLRATGQRILFGWTLIAGENDSPDHARAVASLLRGLDAHVNLIRLNPTEGYAGVTPSDRAAHAFQRVLREAGLPCTIRQRRGIDLDGGCGQLRAARARARRSREEVPGDREAVGGQAG